MNTIANITKAALNPKNFMVMIEKVKKRIFDKKSMLSNDDNMKWLKSHTSDLSETLASINEELWLESLERSKQIEIDARRVLDNIPFDLGEGGIPSPVFSC